MAGIVLGLGLGCGLFCVWWSLWVESPDEGKCHRRPGPLDGLAEELRQAGYLGIAPHTLIGCCLGIFACAGLFVAAVTGVPVVAACFGVIAGYLPLWLVQLRARRRRASLRDLWPEAVDNIGSAVRAGLALPEALSQLGQRGPDALKPSFAAFAVDYRTTGRFHECLDRLKDRLSDPVGDRLVESLRLAREVGGSDLGGLLRTLSTFLREDARTRAELETRQGWTINAARLSVAAPWMVLAMLCTRPESIHAYRSTLGAIILVSGGVLTILAYRVMISIGRLPEDERVLR